MSAESSSISRTHSPAYGNPPSLFPLLFHLTSVFHYFNLRFLAFHTAALAPTKHFNPLLTLLPNNLFLIVLTPL